MSDIQSLLALQHDDLAIHELETRLAALEPRIRELDAKRQRIVDAIARQSATVAAEEKKQAFLRDKIAEHEIHYSGETLDLGGHDERRDV